MEEAADLFAGIRAELEAQSKQNTHNGLQIFPQKITIQAVQKSVGILSKRIDDVSKVLASITESLKNVPSKRELRQHQVAMDEALAQMAEVNTGLTTAMDHYKISESTPFDFRQNIAGPSGTQPYLHLQRAAAMESPSVSSLRDTGSEYSWHARIRGGAESDGAAGGAGDGAAGGAVDAAAGGAGGGAAWDPPPPGDPPPSDHSGAGGR